MEMITCCPYFRIKLSSITILDVCSKARGYIVPSDPSGVYHGMKVKSAGKEYVLSSPEGRFIAGEEEQMDLFR